MHEDISFFFVFFSPFLLFVHVYYFIYIVLFLFPISCLSTFILWIHLFLASFLILLPAMAGEPAFQWHLLHISEVRSHLLCTIDYNKMVPEAVLRSCVLDIQTHRGSLVFPVDRCELADSWGPAHLDSTQVFLGDARAWACPWMENFPNSFRVEMGRNICFHIYFF